MKKIIFLMIVTSVCMAEEIKYETLDNSKKNGIELTDKLRDLQIHSLNYEISNFDEMSNQTLGESFIESLEDENGKFRIGNATYFLGNKNKYNIHSNVYLDKILNYEGTQVSFGAILGYVNGKIEQEKLNGVDVGFLAKSYIPDYKIKVNTEHKFNYTNVKYFKGFEQNYLGLVGGIDLRTTVGKSLYIEPLVRASYTYNFKSKLKDQNTDIIELKPNFNFSVGGGVRVGYNFNDKYRLSLGYVLDKRLKNKNSYKIFNNPVTMNENNYFNHDVDLQFELNLKEKHKITASIGKISKGFKGGMSYKYEW